MKVGIITFQKSNNYGAILQSYALQRSIIDIGHECETIDYDCEYISKPYKIENFRTKSFGSYLFGVIGYICYLPRKRKCNEFRKKMFFSKPVNKQNITDLNNVYDIFVTGSDQVWNYKLTNKDYNFLLEFVDDDTKKFSYAASFGIKDIPNDLKEVYKKNLSTFNKISLREKVTEKLTYDLSGKEAEIVVDPTLLLTKDQWLELSSSTVKKEKYILVYQLNLSKQILTFVKHLSKQTGMKIKFIPFPLGGFLKCKWHLTVGPKEWLGLFANAEYIVTDSFHGTIFSLIFEKKFYVQNTNLSVGSRLSDLLKKLNLEDRLIINGINENRNEINYDKIKKIINTEREKSINYLKSFLDN